MSKRMNSPIVSAVSNDDVALMKTLIESGHSVTNILDKNRNTLLHMSMYHNKFQVFSHLLTLKKIPVDQTNKDGNTALHLACTIPGASPVRFIELLLQNGAEANLKNHNGDTPLLLLARSSKDPNAIGQLVGHGARIDQRNSRAQTALHLACYHLKVELASALLYWGADPLMYDLGGRLPFHWAVEKRNDDLMDLLFPYYLDECYVPIRLQMPIVKWLFGNRRDTMRYMLSHGHLSMVFNCRLAAMSTVWELSVEDLDVVNNREVESLLPGIFFNFVRGVDHYVSKERFLSGHNWTVRLNPALPGDRRVRQVRELLGLFAHWRLSDFVLRNFEEEEDLVRVAKERRVPSLLELGRNAAREHIVVVCEVKSSRDYYKIVDTLPLSKCFKDILSFTRKIYFFK